MKMKFLFSFFFLLMIQFVFAQVDTSNTANTLTLSNITLSNEAKKIVKVRLRGFPSYNGLSQTNAVVSYTGHLPEGQLKSVSFYFNCGLVNRLKKRLKINYKDVKLGLLVYKANPDSTLGELISQNDIMFTVPAQHRGPFKVDLSSLNILESSIFIGFSVLSELPQDENNIYVRYNETKSARTYVKMNLPYMQNQWRKSFTPDATELKLNLEVLQYPEH